jgi:hypothetical protein
MFGEMRSMTLVRGADGKLYRVFATSCERVEADAKEARPSPEGLVRQLSPSDRKDYASARVHVDPGDSLSARVHVDPGDSLSARVHVDPGDSLSARVHVDPGDSLSARVHVDPGT